MDIVLAAIVGALAFLYQKAWERRERRLAKYEAVMDALPGLMAESMDADKIDRMISELRHLWLSAPPPVVRAFNELMQATRTEAKTNEKERELAEFVIAARNDASLTRALIPSLGEQLLETDIMLMRAIRRETQSRNR